MSLKNPVAPPGIDSGTVRLVAQRLSHYATPGPLILKGTVLNLKEKLEVGNQDVRCTEENAVFHENVFRNLYCEEGH